MTKKDLLFTLLETCINKPSSYLHNCNDLKNKTKKLILFINYTNLSILFYEIFKKKKMPFQKERHFLQKSICKYSKALSYFLTTRISTLLLAIRSASFFSGKAYIGLLLPNPL